MAILAFFTWNFSLETFEKNTCIFLNYVLIYLSAITQDAPVAQLDRVSGYEPEGQGFESLPARQKKRNHVFVVALLFLLP